MRIQRISLPGFGCLQDFEVAMAPGLNVFFGLNEAGKSTLQQAICALLYGFYDHDRARAEETARHERFRPWQDGLPFRGALEYELEDGRCYEVRRDFAGADIPTQLIDPATGADLAAQFGRGRHGNVAFARKHLGMPRGVFQSCAFISQGEIFQIDPSTPRQIGDAIAALADSARRDVSAASAITRLDSLLQKLGSDRARTAQLPAARETLRAARAELEALDAARRGVSEKAGQLEATRQRLAEIASDTARLRVLYLRARSSSLASRLADIAAAQKSILEAQEVADALRQFSRFPVHLRDHVVALRERRAEAAEQLLRAANELAATSAGCSAEDRLEYSVLRDTAGALSEESIERLRRVAYRPAAGVKAVRRPHLLIRLLHAGARRLATLLRAVFRRAPARAPEVEAPPSPTPISEEEAQLLLEKHRRFLTLRPLIETLESTERRSREAARASEIIEQELAPLLAGGEGEAAVSDEAMAAFLEGCNSRAEHDAAQAAAEEHRQHLKALLGGRSPEEMSDQLAECDRRLSALLDANPSLAGCETACSTSEIRSDLERLEGEQRVLDIGFARADEEVRSGLRDHRGRAEIEEDLARWTAEVKRLERARACAQLARETIGEAMVAVYRDFAPAVNDFLSQGFAYVTGGRYRRAHVDPASLQVSLLLPETDRVIANPPVSRGTLALAYVLMRIGLAQHMSAIGEPVPLVLDDPFVDIDGRRLPRLLDFLAGLSERSQVLLFTKDPSVLSWLEALPARERHRLHSLSRQAPVIAGV